MMFGLIDEFSGFYAFGKHIYNFFE